MNILVIGGTGFISGALVKMLLADGHRVTVFTRGKSGAPGDLKGDVHFLYGDRRLPSSMQETVDRQTYDVVFDMVAYEPDESRLAAQVFRGKVGRFVHCSTISVYMVSDEVICPVTEDQDKLPAMDPWPRNPFGHDYGINKRRCEDVLWAAHHEVDFPVTMLRPTYVCGPNDPSRRDWFWIQRILDGKPLLVPGSGDHAFQLVYVDDVARAFLLAMQSAEAPGQVYNVSGDEVMSLNEYLQRMMRLMNRASDLIHVDQGVFDEQPISSYPGADVFPFNTRRTAVFGLDKIKSELGYASTPFDHWMLKTIEWYRLNMDKPSAGYEHRIKELAFAERWQSVQRQMRMAPLNGH